MHAIKHFLVLASAKIPFVLGLGVACLAGNFFLHFALRKLLTSPQPSDAEENAA